MIETKFILLMAFILAGALAQHQAGMDVRSIRLAHRTSTLPKEAAGYNDIIFMKRAITLSRVALEKGHGEPFGSIVVQNGKMIGEGWSKTSLLNDPSAHAEMESIRNASKNVSSTDLGESVLYTSAQPCPMCLALIHLAGIDKVYYCIPTKRIHELGTATKSAMIYETLAAPPSKRLVPEVPMMGDAIDAIIASYQRDRDVPM